MSDSDDSTDDTGFRMKCYDCEREHQRRHLNTTEIMDTSGPGIGYEYIAVPLCHHCRKKRFGYDCPNCGITHGTQEKAMFCCRRRPGEAPDCPECGRRMKRLSWGYTADGRPTCEFAECEECGIQWGKFTGWHKPTDGGEQ